MADLCVTPSSTYFLDCLQLGVGCTAALSLEFNRIDLASVESDHVRHAWAHDKPFQPCCFNRAAITTVCGMEGEDVGHAAYRKMLKHRALDRMLALGHQFHREWP